MSTVEGLSSRFFGSALRQGEGRTIETSPCRVNVRRFPIGLVNCLCPVPAPSWNASSLPSVSLAPFWKVREAMGWTHCNMWLLPIYLFALVIRPLLCGGVICAFVNSLDAIRSSCVFFLLSSVSKHQLKILGLFCFFIQFYFYFPGSPGGWEQ